MCIIPDSIFTSDVDKNGGNFGLRGEGRQERDMDEGGVIYMNKDGRMDGY